MELRNSKAEVGALKLELKRVTMSTELESLRTVERLRIQHEEVVTREGGIASEERKRMEEWMMKSEESWRKERELLVSKLEAVTREVNTESTSRDDTLPAESGGDGDLLPDHSATVAERIAAGSVRESATEGEDSVPTEGGVIDTVLESRVTGSGAVEEPMSSSSDPLLQSVAWMLQAQTAAMEAQTRAAAIQNLPPLPLYTGEERQIADDGFECWVERLERARICGWTPEQQLYHMKLLLDRTATEVFCMLPEEDRSDFDKAVSALRQRFKPVDIEELRGLKFHHKTQGGESVEQFGISIQQLGRKAFPSMTGKELYRLLKGRFFQALNVKWQRKLGAPRPDETFYTLYDRARALKSREKQYSSSSDRNLVEINRSLLERSRRVVSKAVLVKEIGKISHKEVNKAACRKGDITERYASVTNVKK